MKRVQPFEFEVKLRDGRLVSVSGEATVRCFEEFDPIVTDVAFESIDQLWDSGTVDTGDIRESGRAMAELRRHAEQEVLRDTSN